MSDIRVGLVGRLPEGDANGLSAIASELDKDPSRIRVGVVLFDVEERQDKVRAGKNVVRVSIRRIENIRDAQDGATMQRILARAFERRTGQTVLPLELESDIEAAFEGLDTDAATLAEQERAEGHTEHVGADDTWADELRAMREGTSPAMCAACGADITWDSSYDGWLDRSGFPEAPDGHKHEPQPTQPQPGTTEDEG